MQQTQLKFVGVCRQYSLKDLWRFFDPQAECHRTKDLLLLEK